MQRLFFFVVLAGTILASLGYARAGDQGSASLTGIVSSDAEGSMEGVLVSAKGVGSTTTVTVVSDSQGRYSFPAARLQPGKYHLGVRAVGYELNDPGLAEVVANKSGEFNLKLNKTQDLSSQLVSTEWMLSVPGTEQQKKQLYGCVGCHSLAPILKSRHTAAEFLTLFERMRNHAPASFLLKFGDLPDKVSGHRPEDAKYAEYLASINLSSRKDGKWNYELKTLPRPKGRATKVIITEYDLPNRLSEPHDAVIDREGMVWFSEFGRSYLGRLNPRTGEVKEWQVPALRPERPEGSLDIAFDKEGNPWLGLLFQLGVAKFDKKTEKITTWSIPPDQISTVNNRTGMIALSPDGTVWTKQNQNNRAHRLDPKTNQWINTGMPPGYGWYGMDVNSQGNLYIAALGKGAIGELDVKKGKLEFDVYPTPTPDSGSRRGHMDSQDRFWFAEYYAGKIGVFDPRTKRIQEWPVPTPWAGSYYAAPDNKGEVWAGGMHSDYFFRLNPATGQVTEYLLPTLDMNIRRVDIDNTTTPVTVWAGECHQGKIAKLEPLD